VEVLKTPSTLIPGAVWKVKIHAMGTTWISRSEARVVDRKGLRFSYRSMTDDGNPSYADWDWQIEPVVDGAKVTLSVTLVPLTFWRRHLFARFRRPALEREMHASLAKLGQLVTAPS